jgi:hypothetical protein
LGNTQFKIARIGDPHALVVPGPHVFQIRYSVAGVLDPGTTGDKLTFGSTEGATGDAPSVFFWKVVPTWNNYIARADISVTLPGRVPGAGCSVGVGSEEKGCDTLDVAGNTLRVSAAALTPHTPVTVRAGVDVPTPARDTVPWAPFRPDSGADPDRRAVGRRRHAGSGDVCLPLVAIRTRQGAGIPTSVLAPGRHRPGTERVHPHHDGQPNALTATLFHLAEGGLITLTQVNEKRWTITGIADYAAWDDMDPVSRTVGYALDVSRPGGEFNANGTAAAGTKLATARNDVKAAVEAWGLREKLLRTERLPVANWLRWTGVLALPIAIVGFASWGFPTTTWGLPFATFFLFSTPA